MAQFVNRERVILFLEQIGEVCAAGSVDPADLQKHLQVVQSRLKL